MDTLIDTAPAAVAAAIQAAYEAASDEHRRLGADRGRVDFETLYEAHLRRLLEEAGAH